MSSASMLRRMPDCQKRSSKLSCRLKVFAFVGSPATGTMPFSFAPALTEGNDPVTLFSRPPEATAE